MVTYVKRSALNNEKYNSCIANSKESKLYAFSWYLDIVADQWDVLVLDDYKAVMPICTRRKLGINYVYPPFWMLELGIFSLDENTDANHFFEFLFKKFKFVESKLNSLNSVHQRPFLENKQMQVLALNEPYNLLFDNYRKDRKKDLKKAAKAYLQLKWNDEPEKLIQLFKNNVGKRTPFIENRDYSTLLKLMHVCIEKNVGDIVSIYNVKNRLVASGFFIKYKSTITILVSSTDFENRNNGENTFLIDRAIYKYQKEYNFFNFGGSSIKSIANYFLSFGAKTKEYQQIKYNNLPFWLKLFKS